MTSELRQKGDNCDFEHTASNAVVRPEVQSQEDAMLIARPLKPRRLSFSGSTASGSGSLSLDDLATPQTTGGLDDALEVDLRMPHGPPPGILDPPGGSGSPRGAPHVAAPALLAMPAPPHSEKPGPCQLSELLPAPSAYASWPVTPVSVPPTPSRGMPAVPVLASGPPTPSGAAPVAFADASNRTFHHRAEHAASDEDALLVQALSLLNSLLSGPTIPTLPPSVCYGGLKVSKAISEALGSEACKVQAAAEGHGENPVKVLLPHYPIHPNILSIDHTQPAKLRDPEAIDEADEVANVAKQPYGHMLNYPGMAGPPRPLQTPPGAHAMAPPMPVIPR